jgi:hypothetical protein
VSSSSGLVQVFAQDLGTINTTPLPASCQSLFAEHTAKELFAQKATPLPGARLYYCIAVRDDACFG